MRTLLLFSLLAFSCIPSAYPAETILYPPTPGGNTYLQTAGGKMVAVNACYTSDGNGNLIPISGGGGGGGGTVTQGPAAATHASPWWMEITDGTHDAGVTTNGLKVDVQASVLPTGAATASAQATAATTLSSILTALQGILSVTPTANPNGSIVNSTSITSTASSFSAPAHAVGFVLEADGTNSDSVRWAVGSTASSSVGSIAEPGRDTGYIPMAATISVAAISGTQAISIQWVLSQ